MAIKKKAQKRLAKVTNKRIKAQKTKVEMNWRNIFIRSGFLREERDSNVKR